MLSGASGGVAVPEAGDDATAGTALLFFAGFSGWKTNGGSSAGSGELFRLCVGRGTIVPIGFFGETCQSSSDHGAICWPKKRRTSVNCCVTGGAEVGSSLLGGGTLSLCAYGRKDCIDSVLPALSSDLMGLPPLRTRRLIGLSSRKR